MEKRIVPQLKGINDYYDQPYNEIYRSVVDIAKDVRRIDSNTSEGIEKCKWVAAMINMLFDTAMHNAAKILHQKNIEFNYESFVAEHKDESQARRYKQRALSEYEYAYELMWCVDYDAAMLNVSADASDVEVEKSLWIMAMCEVLSEVNMDVIYPAFRKIDLHFNWETFAEEHGLL